MTITPHHSRIPLALFAILFAVAATADAGRLQATEASHVKRPFTVACGTPAGWATDFRNHVSEVATGTDSASIETRTLWNIPAVADSQVAFVSDSAKCERAAHAHAVAANLDTTNPPPVFLIRVGPTRYFAFNGQRVGEFMLYYLFDSAFVKLTAIGS